MTIIVITDVKVKKVKDSTLNKIGAIFLTQYEKIGTDERIICNFRINCYNDINNYS